MKFTKMQGTGNDFIIIEDLCGKLEDKQGEIAAKLCDRHFGVGADGILYVKKSDTADMKMVIVNSDGSEASMCGNGIRCFAKYVFENKLVKNSDIIRIETGDGIKEAKLNIKDGRVDNVTINMGKPSFNPKDIPANSDKEIINKEVSIENKKYFLNSVFMGVPHTVVFEKMHDADISDGSKIEKLDLFPQNTNVNFCEVINKGEIHVKTWERGAGATFACGTGCCASVAVANRLQYVGKKVNVKVPGGKLYIEIKDNGIFMTGPCEVSFKGEADI